MNAVKRKLELVDMKVWMAVTLPDGVILASSG